MSHFINHFHWLAWLGKKVSASNCYKRKLFIHIEELTEKEENGIRVNEYKVTSHEEENNVKGRAPN